MQESLGRAGVQDEVQESRMRSRMSDGVQDVRWSPGCQMEPQSVRWSLRVSDGASDSGLWASDSGLWASDSGLGPRHCCIALQNPKTGNNDPLANPVSLAQGTSDRWSKASPN